MGSIEKIRILGSETIFVGENVLAFAAKDISERLKPEQVVIFTDYHLDKLYGQQVKAALEALGIRTNILAIPPGESSKNRLTKERIEDAMLGLALTRKALLLALGGGVIGDMGGYIASTYMRGIKVCQMPTSLLAMVDSSIGGKTGLDVPAGKNLIGAFHQPSAIYISLHFLNSLPQRQLLNGMVEVIKTGAIWDADLFAYLETHSDAIQAKSIPHLQHIIARSAAIKAEVVTRDEKEGALRAILNHGHTVGHAIEALCQPQMLHGEAVAIGIVKECEIARAMNLLSQADCNRMQSIVTTYGHKVTMPRHLKLKDLMAKMAVDKKNTGGQINMSLLETIGVTHQNKAVPVPRAITEHILSPWCQVTPQQSFDSSKPVEIVVPGSKSLSNRVLILAALAKGESTIEGLLHSDDTQVMMEALKRLGISVTLSNKGETVTIQGADGMLTAQDDTELYLGNAGTASRFLTTAVSLTGNAVTLTGNHRMKVRPIRDLGDCLEKNGLGVQYCERPGCLPVTIDARKTGGLPGGEMELGASVSSQYVSSILLSAPYAVKKVQLKLAGGEVVSEKYIDMTLQQMKTFGVTVDKKSSADYAVPLKSDGEAGFVSPGKVMVEADASSSTYPLALAAITGRTITVTNVGNASLQGDAEFCQLLAKMGCTVSQTEGTTTVTGPKDGKRLQAPGTIDMASTTDAFMTMTVLAAVAEEGQVTKIVNIANQRVKECNRILAMVTELTRMGVKCWELEDGLAITGTDPNQITGVPVECYDDHRIAMSFAVLATVVPGIIITDKNCVEKTYPTFWDDLTKHMGFDVIGVEPKWDSLHKETTNQSTEHEVAESVVIIGMRGAGKTSCGQGAAKLLGWHFVDIDHEIERVNECTAKDIIHSRGWDAFRDLEIDTLATVLKEHPTKTVISCGGGIVETEAARTMLWNYPRVISLYRPIDDIVEYLTKDTDRPQYDVHPRDVYERRKPLYNACSKYAFFVGSMREQLTYLQFEDETFSSHEKQLCMKINRSLADLIKRITSKDIAESLPLAIRAYTGRPVLHTESLLVAPSQQVVSEPEVPSYFLSLTAGTVAGLTRDLNGKPVDFTEVTAGVTALELRVDLLRDWDPISVGEQVFALRRLCPDRPVIFTVRTMTQGGRYPDHPTLGPKVEDNGDVKVRKYETQLHDLLDMGIATGCEFIDVETTYPEPIRRHIIQRRQETNAFRIISSCHFTTPDWRWQEVEAEFVNAWDEGAGDIVKIVVKGRSRQDVQEMQRVVRDTPVPKHTPIISLVMGECGKLSRVLNTYMTPVSHPSLPFKAAPGQLSLKEVNQLRAGIGMLPDKTMVLFGSPISKSMSPAIHNMGYALTGLPYTYGLAEDAGTETMTQILKAWRMRKQGSGSDFGGASVTIPHKQNVMPLLDHLTPAATMIGAVNTVVPNEEKDMLVGDNTDWLGMLNPIQARLNAKNRSGPLRDGLVLGAGGTARAACYALRQLGVRRLVVWNRTASKAQALAEDFGAYVLEDLTTMRCQPASEESGVNAVHGDEVAFDVICSTVPGNSDLPFDQSSAIFRNGPVVLDAAYRPKVTPMLQYAQSHGCSVVYGIEMLVAQAVEQNELFTSLRIPFEVIYPEILRQYDASA